jgi:tetratricopeptide (TPR) repeat protein
MAWGSVFGGVIVGYQSKESHQIYSLRKTSNKTTKLILMPILLFVCISIINPLFENEKNYLRLNFVQSPTDSNQQIAYKEFAEKVFNQKWLDPEYKQQIVQLMAKNNFSAETLKLLDSTMKSDSRNLNANIIGAIVNTNLGNYMKAIEFGEKLKRLDPYGAENLYVLAFNYVKTGQRSKARDIVTYISEIAPNSDVSKRASELILK